MVREHVKAGTVLDTRHAFDRKKQRSISWPEIRFVLRTGYREKRKDELKPEHDAWTYAIRGKTVDRRNLRVCVAFDPAGLLIITAIDLDGKD